MKTLLISMLLLFATNQTPKQTEKEWIGTFQVFFNENDEIEIYYDGNFQKCFTLYVLDKMNPECDSILDKAHLDSIFQVTIIEVPKPKIKTKRM